LASDVRSTAQRKDAKGKVRHGGEWLAIWSDPGSLRSEAEKRAEAQIDSSVAARQAALAASIRSISNRVDVDVSFDGRRSATGVSLPALDRDDLNANALRGQADAQATFLRFHDRDLHKTQRPDTPKAARLFDQIEMARCHSLGALQFGGIEDNLIAFQVSDLERLDLLNAHLASLVPLKEALRMLCRDAFCDRATPSIQTSGFRIWDRWLRERFSQNLSALKAVLADQAAFAAVARTFVDALLVELPSGGEIDRQLSPTASDPNSAGDEGAMREVEDDKTTDIREAGATLDDEDADEDAQFVTSDVAPKPYRALTTRHDRVVQANDLADGAALRKARLALDEKQADFRRDIARLSTRLQRTLMARQARRWEFDQDEGLIDASRLDRVIVKPGFSSCYKNENASPFLDTIVTLLIDNSGSMRGKPVETACIVADVLAAALERCSVTTEILGFTTRNWKGGQSAKDWRAAGKGDDPGRLNDLLHVIYKDASTPLRRARDSICAMLSPGLLKENIDGEALIWAASRLLNRPEQRRLLIVISDGAPVDQATVEANSDKQLLDRHLRDTIGWIDRETNIELSAIGIRHDLHDYYRRAVTINDAKDLGAVLVDSLDEMLKF